jgi:hypothetical protein
VSDNSSIETNRQFINSIKDNRLRYFNNGTNIGGIRNVIEAARRAKGIYVCFCSDEDYINVDLLLDELYNTNIESILLPSGVKADGSYYRTYKKKTHNFPWTVRKFLFTQSYLTGITIRREKIDFELLDVELAIEGFGKVDTYPTRFMVDLLILNKSTINCTDKLIVTKGLTLGLVDLELINDHHYYHTLNVTQRFQKEIEMLFQYEDSLCLIEPWILNRFQSMINSLLVYRHDVYKGMGNYHFDKTRNYYYNKKLHYQVPINQTKSFLMNSLNLKAHTSHIVTIGMCSI